MMNSEDPLQRLSQLTERQREVLQLFCAGLDYKAIGEELFIAVPTVKTHMGNIYIKLGTDHLPPARRRIVLVEKYCPLLSEGELPPAPSDETEEPEPVPESVMRMVEEDERAITPWEPPKLPVTIIEAQPVRRRRRLPGLLVGMASGALLMLLLVCTVYIAWRFLPAEPQPGTEAPETEASDVTVQVVYTPARLEPTSTTLPTFAPSATPAPSPRPVLIPLPFADDFDEGPRPEWEPVQGTWRMVDGKYTPDPSELWSLTLVGDAGWTDYQVDVDLTVCWLAPVRIIVRAQNDSYMALETGYSDTNWILMTDGDPRVIAHSGEGAFRFTCWHDRHLRIEAKGSIYSAYSDESLLLRVQDDTLTRGRVGLAYKLNELETTRFDNFRVTELP